MQRLILLLATVLLLCGACTEAQPSPEREQAIPPFKLGTFERGGTPFVGIVLDESSVIHLGEAGAALGAPASGAEMPTDMRDVISRYDHGVRQRIGDVLATLSEMNDGDRPDWVYDLAELRVLPPVVYPMTMLNMAVNYREHDIEMAAVREGAPDQSVPTGGEALPGTESASGIWERDPDDPRWNPYMFLKATASIIADGEPIRIPSGRDRIEWECEMAIVIGDTARRVSPERASDHIFGYTLHNDVSDRGGRGDTRYGSDWLVTKSQDTFAPLGPFITPKEFVPDPHALEVRFILNGEALQEGSTAQMIHTVEEMLSYGSNLLTLRPGDIIATGTPPGSGSARTPPIFLQPGDVSVCTYEGIGTLTNPIEGSR